MTLNEIEIKRVFFLNVVYMWLIKAMSTRWLIFWGFQGANVQCKESYRDHMAALMSLYFDMALLAERYTHVTLSLLALPRLCLIPFSKTFY